MLPLVVRVCAAHICHFGVVGLDINFEAGRGHNLEIGQGFWSVVGPSFLVLVLSGSMTRTWMTILDDWTEFSQPLPTHCDHKGGCIQELIDAGSPSLAVCCLSFV